MIQTIGFDADDTLWQNEHLYADARRKYDAILRSSASVNGHGIPANLDDIVHEIEVGNLPYYGYGITSFVMSLIETAIRVTDGRITGRELGEIQDIAKQMVAAEVELLDAVEETLADLSADYPLILITKGDLLHQQRRWRSQALSITLCTSKLSARNHRRAMLKYCGGWILSGAIRDGR
ncbi:MAG: hypothetical protein R3C44_15010 [Chloroflexota bacterium]